MREPRDAEQDKYHEPHDKYNKHNEFIIYSYITDHFPTLINILKSNNIKYTLLTDEFNTDFIII